MLRSVASDLTRPRIYKILYAKTTHFFEKSEDVTLSSTALHLKDQNPQHQLCAYLKSRTVNAVHYVRHYSTGVHLTLYIARFVFVRCGVFCNQEFDTCYRDRQESCCHSSATLQRKYGVYLYLYRITAAFCVGP